nr:cupin domain-containing protein [Gordonia sp. SID5947]
MAANEITAGPATSASSPTEHAGEEFVYVIDGELEVEVGTTTYSLAPGDVLYYASTIPHRWHNRADRPTRFLITSSPPF